MLPRQALNPGIRGYEAALQACAQGAGRREGKAGASAEGMHLMDKTWGISCDGESISRFIGRYIICQCICMYIYINK